MRIRSSIYDLSPLLLALVVIMLTTACSWFGGGTGDEEVTRGEFNNLSGRVGRLEDVVIRPGSGTGTISPPPANSGSFKTTNPTKPAAYDRSAYNRGQSLLRQKKYAEAASIFTNMLTDNPTGPLAPNARYWLGECYYARGDFQSALNEFRHCLSDYPASNKAPDSLLKISYCQNRLGDAPGAMESLKLLLLHYPDSPSAEMVKSGRTRFSEL